MGYRKFLGRKGVLTPPLDENGILGMVCGLALAGLRPVAEIQFVDFTCPGFDVLMSDIPEYRFRSGNQFSVLLVSRSPYGGSVKGGLYHSQSPESIFSHISGLKVVILPFPRDAKGLLKSSKRDDDPVIFLEPKKIYFTVKEKVPEDPEFLIPLWKANVPRSGNDITIVSYGYVLHECLEAAEELERRKNLL